MFDHFCMDELPLSYFLVDKQFRLYNAILGRCNALRFQQDYALSHKRPFDFPRASAVLSDLLELSHRLVTNSLFCNTTYLDVLHAYSKYPRRIQDHSQELYGFWVPRKLNLRKTLDALKDDLYHADKGDEDLVSSLQDLINKEEKDVAVMEFIVGQMKRSCYQARRRELLDQLILEARLRVSQGWFVVFNTLTVSGHYESDVFGPGSTAWTDFIRSIKRAVGIKCYGSWRKALASGEDFASYFAVVERGERTGKLHIHVLHFLKALPDGCSDPNIGAVEPCRREIDALKKFWRYGFSSPVAVRLDMSDAYAKLYWRWPVEMVDGRWVSISCGPVDRVCWYIGKYLTKAFCDDLKSSGKDGRKWRTKVSQRLGQPVLSEVIKRCSSLQLEAILRIRCRRTLEMHNRSLPLWRLKVLAARSLSQRSRIQTPRTYWKMMLDLKPRDGFLKRLRCMIHPSPVLKLVSTGSLRILDLSKMVGSSLVDLVNDVGVMFFGVLKSPLVLRGNTMEVRSYA